MHGMAACCWSAGEPLDYDSKKMTGVSSVPASGVDGEVSGQPDTCELGGDFLYARNWRRRDYGRSHQEKNPAVSNPKEGPA
jgi:hypothetical protein